MSISLFDEQQSMYIVYGTPTCPYCDRAKMFLEQNGENYEYIDVSQNVEAKQMFIDMGLRTVPQIFKDKNLIGGFSELVQNFR